MADEHVIRTLGPKAGSGSGTLPIDQSDLFALLTEPALGCVSMLPDKPNVASSPPSQGSSGGACARPSSHWKSADQTTPPDSTASAPQHVSGPKAPDSSPYRVGSAVPDTARPWSTSENFRVPLPDKSNTRARRVFTQEEDEALIRGFERLGSQWAQIARHPAFKNRRSSTDVRDRFRNAFPEEYARAGYKPRVKSSKRLERNREAHRVTRSDATSHRQIKPLRLNDTDTALFASNVASSSDANPRTPLNVTMEPSTLSPLSYDASPQGIPTVSSPTSPMSESVMNMLALTPTAMIPSISPPSTPQVAPYSIPDLSMPTTAAVPIPTMPQSFHVQPPFSIPMSVPTLHASGPHVPVPSSDAFVSPSLPGYFPDTTATSFSMPAPAPAFPQSLSPTEPVSFAPSVSLPLSTGGGGPLPESASPPLSSADVSLLSLMMMQTPTHMMEPQPRAPPS